VKRGARFLVLDQDDKRNEDADYIILELPAAQLRALLNELTLCTEIQEHPTFVAQKSPKTREVWAVHLLVEASHPKTVGQDPKDVKHLPTLLKDSIPRAGRS
jgi:hypothetical protein